MSICDKWNIVVLLNHTSSETIRRRETFVKISEWACSLLGLQIYNNLSLSRDVIELQLSL